MGIAPQYSRGKSGAVDPWRGRDLVSVRRFLLAVLLWIALPLLVVEVAMIVLDPLLFRGFYQYDEELGFRVRPGEYGSNEFGFNDRDYPLEREPGTFRILVLGDSFSWAGGKDGNYTTLMEDRFAAYYGDRRVEVINAGYSMTHTVEQLALLRKFGLRYAPDMVLLAFTAGNDFFDADPNRRRIVLNGLYIDVDRRSERSFLGYPLVPQSRLRLFVKQQLKIRSELAAGRKETVLLGLPDDQPVFSEDTYLQIQAGRMRQCRKEVMRRGLFDPNIRYILDGISSMEALLDERGIAFAIAVIPAAFQVDTRLQDQVFERFSMKRRDYELDCVQGILGEFARAEGIQLFDLLPTFRAGQREEDLYVHRDGHWNAAGNRLASEELFERIRTRVRGGDPP